MRASQLGVHIGWALSWTIRARAFLSTPAASSHALRANSRVHKVKAIPASRSRGVADWVKSIEERRALGVSVVIQPQTRTPHRWQPRLFMSSSEGMNPESFTERAWEAMVKLPTLADTNKAQVMDGFVIASTCFCCWYSWCRPNLYILNSSY